MASENGVVFEDFFPAMMEKLGTDGFMKELCNGFRLLVDEEKGVITFESLKRESGLLGLKDMSDEEVMCMIREGDLDGDGGLNEMEFCTLMFRLSPALMKDSTQLLAEAISFDESRLFM
ncbi:calcium-binding protein PBP1-like [Tripterygium wilfordii]|uniref:Calcium-binding protein PBP1-like n=1 Tax=Tripterygium wilfordii TaxID=458696 RepID=A0A7J7D767_TRIWF|nr:calcium-binding protein KRP1-like [Tripterygium wilfordii]KAF5742220.1 calcium-binding protein PBP1-like [Tripterygium wilfordii]